MQKFFCYLIIGLLIILPLPVLGANFDVVINEIAWMGTTIPANDEWIELYNNTDNSINLDGWQLISQDGTPKITLSGAIPANGFYLLERTNDDTIPGISADKIYTGALGNNGEDLKLYDNLNNIVDEVDCSAEWLAGDNKTKQTMERKSPNSSGSDPANWQISQNPGGTPKTRNSTGTPQNNQKLPTDNPLLIQQPEIKKNYPSGIVFNEILPSPEGSDETEEWIELFNQNNEEINISDWQIKDAAGKITTFTIPKGTKIGSLGYLVLSRPQTKITLNNDADGLELLRPDGKVIDSVNYEKAPQGQSYNRADSGWVWNSNLSPGSENNIASSPSSEKQDLTEGGHASPSRKMTASVSEQFSKSFPSLKVLLIALAIAVFSGSIILILKRKIKTGGI